MVLYGFTNNPLFSATAPRKPNVLARVDVIPCHAATVTVVFRSKVMGSSTNAHWFFSAGMWSTVHSLATAPSRVIRIACILLAPVWLNIPLIPTNLLLAMDAPSMLVNVA